MKGKIPRSKIPSIQLTQWFRDNFPDASVSELVDCAINIFGKIYHQCREENAELLRAQSIMEGIQNRHSHVPNPLWKESMNVVPPQGGTGAIDIRKKKKKK